jgi:hypothetical protein
LVVLVVGLPSNVRQLSTYSPRYATPNGTRQTILSVPHLPLSYQLRNSRVPYPGKRLSTEGLTLGWLVDSADRIPDPEPAPPIAEATQVLALMVQPSGPPSARVRCAPLRTRILHTFDRGEIFSIERGSAFVRYVPEGSAPSLRQPFRPDNYAPVVGPLRLLFVPLDKGVDLCR